MTESEAAEGWRRARIAEAVDFAIRHGISAEEIAEALQNRLQDQAPTLKILALLIEEG